VIAVIPSGLNPTGIAAHPDGRTLYVVNYGDSTLTVMDTDSTSAAAYSARASLPVDTGGQSVTVTPDGARVIVGTATGLLVVNTADVSARQSITINDNTKSVTVTPDGGLAVVLTTSGKLLLIDIVPGSPTEGQARASLPTTNDGKSVAVSPDGAFVYVTDDDGFVAVYEIVIAGGGAAVANLPGSPYSLQELPPVTVGENPEGLAFDPSGSGRLFVVNAGSETVSIVNAGADLVRVPADLEITPDPLRFIHDEIYFNARVEFPAFLDPELLDLGSVRLEGELMPASGLGGPGDFDENGVPDYLLKFNRLELLELFPQGNRLALTVTGEVDGTPFAATDTIDVSRVGVLSPAPQQVVALGSAVEIRWASVPGAPDHTVNILWSADGGETWDPAVQGVEDDSVQVWTPAGPASENCLVRVEMRDELDRLINFGVMSGPFILAETTGERDRPPPARFRLLPASPNPFRAGTAIRFDLAEPGPVSLHIFALDGSLVRILARGREYPAGEHSLSWDGADEAGRRVGAGVYFMRIVAGPEHAARKVVKVD
jgi:DNA-binding beta-propeller fold protein YncE